MIFVCELTIKGASHEKVNSAFLQSLRLAYPAEAITLFADATHVAALRAIAEVDGLDFSPITFVPIHIGQTESALQYFRYRPLLRGIFQRAVSSGAERILFLSANAAAQVQAKRLHASPEFSNLHFTFVLHAAFEQVATDTPKPLKLIPLPGRGKRLMQKLRDKGVLHVIRALIQRFPTPRQLMDWAWHRLTRRHLDVARVMHWQHSNKISYLALSPHVIENARRYLDVDELNIHAVVLPTVFKDTAPHFSADHVRFAVFGFGNSTMLYNVMTRLSAKTLTRPYEVRIVGMDNRGTAGFPNVNAVSEGRFMDRQEMERQVTDIDMFLILYDRSRYRLSCSNAVLEALSYSKPILYFRNDCVDFFSPDTKPIGYRADDVEEFADRMADLINGFPRQRPELELFAHNIGDLRSKYSLSSQTDAFRIAYEGSAKA